LKFYIIVYSAVKVVSSQIQQRLVRLMETMCCFPEMVQHSSAVKPCVVRLEKITSQRGVNEMSSLRGSRAAIE